jgi:hypothetical protein
MPKKEIRITYLTPICMKEKLKIEIKKTKMIKNYRTVT